MAPLLRFGSALIAQLGTTSMTQLLILLFYYLLILPQAHADCFNDSDFTATSTYAVNRRLLLSFLATNVTANGGFFSGGLGTSPDTVYAISYCSGDFPAKNWTSTVNSTAIGLMQSCPHQKRAAAFWFETPCNVRYSDSPIYGILDMSANHLVYNTRDITMSQDKFHPIWRNHLESLAAKASEGSTKLKFATGEASLPDYNTIYALLQCSPDLSLSDCYRCLVNSIDMYQICCQGKSGGVSAYPSCFMRWDLYYFYQYSPIPPPPPARPPPPPPQSPSPPPTPGSPPPVSTNASNIDKGDSRKEFLLVEIVVPAICFLIIVVILFLFCRRWKSPCKPIALPIPNSTEEWSGDDSRIFKLNEIRAATDNFSAANKVGQGAFGKVYKGRLASGQQIAVKRLEKCSNEGKHQFKNEMMLMGRLQHKNLVKLVGFCFEEGERIVICEFVPYASLDRFISDPTKRVLLNWEKRYRIMKGIARGLLYLHVDSQLTIIHRDLKPGNVLLDEEMNPKIADFGTARLFGPDQSKERTSKIAGTRGYMPPEYIKYGEISLKTDVYSFGVIMLEIISGQKNGYHGNSGSLSSLASHAWKIWKKGTPMIFVDPFLKGSPSSEILKCFHIALLCIQEEVARRPVMASINLMLNHDSHSLPVPSRPAFLVDISSMESLIQDQKDRPLGPSTISINEASSSDMYPR